MKYVANEIKGKPQKKGLQILDTQKSCRFPHKMAQIQILKSLVNQFG